MAPETKRVFLGRPCRRLFRNAKLDLSETVPELEVLPQQGQSPNLDLVLPLPTLQFRRWDQTCSNQGPCWIKLCLSAFSRKVSTLHHDSLQLLKRRLI
jgi:hypothetical protein